MPVRENPARAALRRLRAEAAAKPLSDDELDRGIRGVKGGGLP